jgi:hypothetical protein
VNTEGETEMGPAADAAMKANVIRSVGCHLKENRIEYAVFTLLLYSVGLLDKAWTYGTGMCV